MSFPVGAFANLGIDGVKMEFKAIDPTDSAHHLVDASQDRIWGSRIPKADNVVPGNEVHRYHILMEPTVEEFATLLPLMGIPLSSGTTYIVDETVQDFPLVLDNVSKVQTYSTAFVDKWILRGQKGLKPWALELQVVALADTEGNAGSFALSAPGSATGPYAFSMGAMTLGGNTHKFDQFTLACDNKLVLRYNNAETADDAVATTSQMFLGTSVPYETANEIALFTTGAGSSRHTGFAGTLAFTFGTVSTTFSFGNLKSPNQPPGIRSKFSEIRLPRWFSVYESGVNPQLTVVHDSTP